MAQKKMFHLFREAKRLNSYAEYPMFPGDVDPQVHLSRNDVPQPFHLICDGDVVFNLLSGGGTLEFKCPTVNYYPMVPGDSVYVPAGMPHRFVPTAQSVIMRVKAQFPKLEGICWYCDRCGTQLHRHVWDAALQFCQEGYLQGCSDFNASEDLRTCSNCEHVQNPVDISWNSWRQIADTLREEGVTPSAELLARSRPVGA